MTKSREEIGRLILEASTGMHGQAAQFIAAECLALAVERAEVVLLREALEEIAFAGMSPSPEMSQNGVEAWHARQAWRFISIAARALNPTQGATK